MEYMNWRDLKGDSFYQVQIKKYCSLGEEILNEQRKGSKRNKKKIKELIDIRKSIIEEI